MASSSFDFDRALAYALSCVKQEGICLKDQQVEAVKRLTVELTVKYYTVNTTKVKLVYARYGCEPGCIMTHNTFPENLTG